jgi:hypothetical protein
MKKLFLFLCLGALIFSCGNDTDEPDESMQDTISIENTPDFNQFELESDEVDEDEVPQPIKETIEYQFTGYKIANYEKIKNGNYKVELEKDDIKTTAILTTTGKIIKINN